MKTTFTLLYIAILSFTLSTTAKSDEFYIISGKDINLDITYQNNTHKNTTLTKNKNIKIYKYKKICSSSESEYEIGIIERKSISLKPQYPCYKYEQIKAKKSTLKNLLTLKFIRIKNNLRIVSTKKDFVIAEGRGTPIQIKKSQYPSIRLEFKRNKNKKTLTLIRNQHILSKQAINTDFEILDKLETGDIYIVKIEKENGRKDIQRFEIIK